MYEPYLGVGTQVINLQLQFTRIDPVVITVKHSDKIAAVRQDAAIEIDRIRRQTEVLGTTDIDDSRVLSRITLAHGLRIIRRGIITDVDA